MKTGARENPRARAHPGASENCVWRLGQRSGRDAANAGHRRGCGLREGAVALWQVAERVFAREKRPEPFLVGGRKVHVAAAVLFGLRDSKGAVSQHLERSRRGNLPAALHFDGFAAHPATL